MFVLFIAGIGAALKGAAGAAKSAVGAVRGAGGGGGAKKSQKGGGDKQANSKDQPSAKNKIELLGKGLEAAKEGLEKKDPKLIIEGLQAGRDALRALINPAPQAQGKKAKK